MKLYLVRHAESRRNAKQKSHENPELSEVGKEQARRLGSYFHKINLKKIYCSNLKRAKSTLNAIKPYVKKVPVTYTVKLIEHKMGIYEQKGHDNWQDYVRNAKKQKVPFHLFKPKYGDSLLETYQRAGNFYKELLEKHSQHEILIVGHGIFLLYLILNILELDLSEGKYYRLNNASISTLEIKKGKVKEFHINDYNHLIKEGMKKNDKKNQETGFVKMSRYNL